MIIPYRASLDAVESRCSRPLREAEPISLLYEKGRVLHRHGLDQLESEMMAFSREWDRAVDGSPNRLDAMIWGITRLSKIITYVPIA